MELTTINSRILSFGKYYTKYRSPNLVLNYIGGYNIDDHDSPIDEILEFDPIQKTWKQIGNMLQKRGSFGLSNINFSDFEEYCTFSD